MPFYNDLTLKDEKFMELRRFAYDFTLNKFTFSNKYKEFDEDFVEFFNPHFISNDEFRTKLEEEVLALKEKPGKFDFKISHFSKGYGLRYYRVLGSNKKDNNIVYGIIYDVTNEHDLLQRMNHAERLRMVGELSGGIAHDFNNNLMVISGASELLLLGDLTDKQRDYVNKIYQAARRSAELSKKLLSFSRVKEDDELFDLVNVVNNVIDIVSYTAKTAVTIRFNKEMKNAYVYGNSSEIANAIINLVKNAIEASGEDVIVDINLGLECLIEMPINSITTIKPSGEYYKLDIIDYGTGISKENIDKIFNPFFTTKTETDGTGLGLAAVLSTVIASKGIISLKTEENEGSTFTLYFLKHEH